MRISDWSSDVCSSDLLWRHFRLPCPLGLIAVLSAWLFWKANCDGVAGAVAAMEAQLLNDPLSNKKRAGAAGSSWGCRVGGSLKRSGETVRAHVWPPGTHAYLVFRLLLENNKNLSL